MQRLRNLFSQFLAKKVNANVSPPSKKKPLVESKERIKIAKKRTEIAFSTIRIIKKKGVKSLSKSELVQAKSDLLDLLKNFGETEKKFGANWARTNDALNQVNFRLREIGETRK